jgi:hypothetical protein
MVLHDCFAWKYWWWKHPEWRPGREAPRVVGVKEDGGNEVLLVVLDAFHDFELESLVVEIHNEELRRHVDAGSHHQYHFDGFHIVHHLVLFLVPMVIDEVSGNLVCVKSG